MKIISILLLLLIAIGCAGQNKNGNYIYAGNINRTIVEIPYASPAPEIKKPAPVPMVQWRQFGQDAGREMLATNKIMVVFLYADDDQSNQMQSTFDDPQVIQLLNDHFIPVRVHGINQPETKKFLVGDGVNIYPITMFLQADDDGDVWIEMTLQGPLGPTEYLLLLNAIVKEILSPKTEEARR